MARKSILRLARYAPRDGRVFLGVERPPFETQTFYSTFRWDAGTERFLTFPQGYIGYFSHFIDFADLPKPPLNPKSFRESVDLPAKGDQEQLRELNVARDQARTEQ